MVIPPKHPKMIIFSRKTHGCWVPPFLETSISIHFSPFSRVSWPMSLALKHWTLGRVVSAPPTDRLDEGGDFGVVGIPWSNGYRDVVTIWGGQMDETLSDWCELGINYFLRLDWTGYRYEKPCIAPLNYSKCLEDIPDQRPDQWFLSHWGVFCAKCDKYGRVNAFEHTWTCSKQKKSQVLLRSSCTTTYIFNSCHNLS